MTTGVDPLWPKGGRPACQNGDGRPVYLAGLCGPCYAGRRPAIEATCAACGDVVMVPGDEDPNDTLCAPCADDRDEGRTE